MNRMIEKLKIFTALVTMFFMLFAGSPMAVASPIGGTGGGTAPPAGGGVCGSASGSTKDQILSGAGEAGNPDCNGKGINSLASTIVNILSLIIGIAAIIVIVISGLRYITSGGDSNKVGAAKSSLIYAVIGLVIVALAQLIVHFVLFQTNKAVG